MQYSLDQYTLIPKAISNITHRNEINLYDKDGKLPIFVAPMTCLLNRDNFDTFLNSAFIPIYPIWNGESIRSRLQMSKDLNCWVSLSLSEFEEAFTRPNEYAPMCADRDTTRYKILIDCADGHLQKIFDLVKLAKSFWGSSLKVMTGNIANPETYLECCKAGIDYVRVGIGGGSGCTTSVQTGFHAGMGWLLEGIQTVKVDCTAVQGFSINPTFEEVCEDCGWTSTKIIADGGINTISKAVKALALGADYVMMGKCFAQCEEACTNMYPSMSYPKVRDYYGQASEQGQIDRFGKVKGNPEGIGTTVIVEWTLDTWTKKLDEVFRSALSYGGAHNFGEFIGNVKYDLVSNSEFKAFDK